MASVSDREEELSFLLQIRILLFIIARSRPFLIVFTLLTWISMSFEIALLLSTGRGEGVSLGLFNDSSSHLSEKYKLPITYTEDTFIIWDFIFFYDGLLLLYVTISLCRASCSHITSSLTMLALTLANICEFIWLYVWDSESMWGSFFLMSLHMLFIWIAFFVAWSFWSSCQPLYSTFDWWTSQVLILNSIGFTLIWVSMAAILNLAIALKYGSRMDEATASLIGLALWAALIIVYVIGDLYFIWRRLSDICVAPYLVLVVTFEGAFRRDTSLESTESVYCLSLLLLSCVLFIGRLALAGVLVKKRHESKMKCSCKQQRVTVSVTDSDVEINT